MRLLAAALVLALASPARADAGLDLARVGVHEAGWLASSDELAAIAAAAQSRCSRCALATALHRASPRLFAGRTSRAWALWLRRDLTRPWAWPESVPWPAYRERWAALLERADAVARGERAHACTEAPHTWGGPMDRARAERLGFVKVDCGNTRNDFYRYPAEGE